MVISIDIPVVPNHLHSLKNALNSLLKQTISSDEIIESLSETYKVPGEKT